MPDKEELEERITNILDAELDVIYNESEGSAAADAKRS